MMTNGQPAPQSQAGGHTWYGGGNAPPPQTFGQPPIGGTAAGFGPAQSGAAGGGGFAPQGQSARPSSNETVIAGIAHLSSFFAPLVAPLLIWLLTRDSMPYASRQGKQAFFFHLIFSIISTVLVLIFFVLFFLGTFSLLATSANSDGALPGTFVALPIGFLLFFSVILVIGLASMGFSIYAAIQAFQGKPFSYPFLERL